MGKWKLAWCYAKNNLYHLIDTNRLGVTVVFSSFFILMLYGCVGNYMRSEDISVSIFEMLPAVLADRSIQMYLLIALLIFFSDAPFLREGISHAVLRGTKKSWLFGQYLYMITVSVMVFFILWFVMLLSCIPKLTVSMSWTEGFQNLVQNMYKIPSDFGIDLTGAYSLQSNPVIVFGKCFVSFVLFACFIGSLLFCFRFITGGAWGYMTAASLYCINRLIDSVVDWNKKWTRLYQFSPFAVFKNFTKGSSISFLYAVIFFLMLILLMFGLCRKRLNKFEFK